MATYSIKAPDGNTYQIDGPDGAAQSDVIQQVLAQHPTAATPIAPIKGYAADIGSAASNMLTDIGTGAKSLFGDANKAAIEGQAAREETAKKYETSDSMAKIKEAYDTHSGLGALTSAAGAAFKEVPHVIAGALPMVAEMGAPALAGGFLGGSLGTALAGPAGGVAGAQMGSTAGAALGAGLAYMQAMGSGVTGQAAEQQAQGKDVDVSVGRAAAFAVPETALNYVGHLAPLGKTVVGKLLGPQVEALLARGATKEADVAAQQVLADRGFLKTLGVGVAEGAAIGAPTMVAQTALERAQAGKDLFSPEALHEYGSAFTNGLLASPMGAVGSFSAKGQAEKAIAGRAEEVGKAAREAEEARKQTPEYAQEVGAQVQDLREQREALKSSMPEKPVKDSPTYEEDAALHEQFKKQTEDLDSQLKELAPEHERTQTLHSPQAETTAEAAQLVNPIEALKTQERDIQRKLIQPLPDKATPEYEGAVAERKAAVVQVAEIRKQMRDVAAEQAIPRPPELPTETTLPMPHAEVKANYEEVVAQRQQAKEAVSAAVDPVAKKAAVIKVQELTKQAKAMEPAYNKAQAEAKSAAPEVPERAAQLMKDPELARRYLTELPHASDYTPEQNGALQALVKLQLAAYDKKSGAPTPPTEASKPLTAAQQKELFGVALGAVKTGGEDLLGRVNIAAQKAAVQGDFKGVAEALSGSKNATIAEVGRLAKNLKTKIRIDDTAAETHDATSTFKAPLQESRAPELLRTDKPPVTAAPVAGRYEAKEDTVLVHSAFAKSEHVLAHEIVHAQTVHAIASPTPAQRPAVERIKNLYGYVKKALAEGGKDTYGLTSPEEFVAEGLSNPNFQHTLSTIPYQNTSVWGKFTESIAKLLGLTHNNAFTELLTAYSDITRAKPSNEPKTARTFQIKVNENLKNAVALADEVIAPHKGIVEKVKDASANGDLMSLGIVTKMIDQYEPIYRALKGKVSEAVGMRVAYGLKEFNQGSNLISAAMRYGAPKLVESRTSEAGAREHLFETDKNAPSMESLNKILTEAHSMTGSDGATGQLWSLYTAAARAVNVGLHKLNFSTEVTQARLNKAMADIRATPGLEAVFKRATEEWKKINAANIEFTVQTGFLSKETANILLKNEDYVPYYREDAHGNVDIFAGGTKIARIGSVVDHPYLHELVGDNTRILDFNAAATQNISMLIRAGLKNYAAQGAAEALHSVGMADLVKGVVANKQDNAFTFKKDGVEYRAIVNDSNPNVPAKLLVQGLQGIPTQTNALLKLAGMPSQLMRTMYVSNPLAAVKNIFKDTMSAWLVSGSDLKSVLGAFKSVEDNLMVRRGLSGGEVFQGLPADQAVLLNQVRSGKPGWATAVAKLHAVHARLDAVSRQARYESYLKEGMSDLGASLAALNSANFTRRGMSSSMHILNTLNPFINSQIQGMDNLYRAARGTMMFDEKLQIRKKMIQRGMIIATSSLLYAALMQEDPEYQQATPDQKYNNWFVHIPGIDESVRVPIPFEAGLLFKAIPEAMMSYMYGNDKDAADGMKMVLQRTIPGGDTYGIPLALRPAIEVGLGKSFYTGRDLETKHEQGLEAGYRQRANTSALADSLGEQLGLSPIKIDHLISGHTGTLGLAVAQIASSLVFGKDTPEIEGKMSQVPVLGSSFQPEDAGNLLNRAYAAMEEASQVKRTYDDLISKGRYDAAQVYLDKNAAEYNKASMGTQFQQSMSELSKTASMITNNTAIDMSPKERRDALKTLRDQQTTLAKGAISALGETTPR